MWKHSEKTIKQLKVWAVIGVILPIVFLASLFLISLFGFEEAYQRALVIGATIMFTTATIWWWWVLSTIFDITKLLSRTNDRFDVVREDLTEIKKEIKKLK